MDRKPVITRVSAPQPQPQYCRNHPQSDPQWLEAVEDAEVVEYVEKSAMPVGSRIVRSLLEIVACQIERQADKARKRRKWSALRREVSARDAVECPRRLSRSVRTDVRVDVSVSVHVNQ